MLLIYDLGLSYFPLAGSLVFDFESQDSGGVQEETCISRVPCVTLGYNTEQPETLNAGSNILAGTNPNEILTKTMQMMSVRRVRYNSFGDENAGKKIVRIILS